MERRKKSSLRPDKVECVNYNLRTAYRKISKLYDKIMEPAGISSGQFFLMGEISRGKDLSIVQLAKETDLDRTTLSRNLKILEKKGLVLLAQGENLKTKKIILTAKGKTTLNKAVPYWHKAQETVLKKIGKDRWQEIKSTLETL